MTARMTGRWLRGLGLGLALTGLGACVETAPAVPLRAVPLPESFIRLVIDSALAEILAEECPGEFGYNEKAREAAIERFAAANPELAIYSEAEWDATANGRDIQLKAQNTAFAFITKRKIVVTDPASWCAAGRYEKTNKTAIGAFLIAK